MSCPIDTDKCPVKDDAEINLADQEMTKSYSWNDFSIRQYTLCKYKIAYQYQQNMKSTYLVIKVKSVSYGTDISLL